MTRIHLVRHGRAAAGWDVDRDPGLDALGAQQAAAVAERLAPLGPLEILSSPLRRCRETAGPLAAAWAAEVAKRNARDFIQRRLTTPTVRCACARLECTATIRGGAYAV